MKIVCDDKIPYIEAALHELADEVVMKPGKDITPDDVRDAHILVVRTRTRCDERLLGGSRVFLVVTATIGYDHLDTHWLETHAIAWANCPGCNAGSVGQYVKCSLLQLKRQRGVNLRGSVLGIVGVGHVGSAVLEAVRPLGLKGILLNDPPRQASGQPAPEGMEWSTLERLEREADIFTFHTPLTAEAPYPTLHLAGADFFRQLEQRPGRIIINAARGGVVDEQALLHAMDEGVVREAAIDTWEGEPTINRELLQRAFIATPHVAGYSADGKANATRQTLRHICTMLLRPMTFEVHPPALPADFRPSPDAEELALQLYDPLADTLRLRTSPDAFERLRGSYPLRREFVEKAK